MPSSFTADDHRFMQQALRLAARGRGAVEPNPMVGSVVVRNGQIVGQGYHRRFGQPHAEVEALRQAAAKAKNATLYVTLEPCCHWGKQPPCTGAILDAGITRVVAAMVDPFPPMRGKGLRTLRKAGVSVEVGLLQDQARDLNAPFRKRLATGQPWVIAKWAQSLDGCIATASGDSKWISSEASRQRVQILRGQMDAIIVGLGTALHDDPLLIARPARGRDIKRIATRIIFDSACRLPLDSQLVQTIAHAPLMVVHSNKLNRAAEARRQKLAQRGVMTVGVDSDSADRPSVGELLIYLGARDYTNVLVEGGPELMAAFARGGHIDETLVFIAPILIGGQHAKHPIAGSDLHKLSEAIPMNMRKVETIDKDIVVFARRRCTQGG